MAAVLLDIDGVLQVSGVALPGAVDVLRRLRADGHRLRFLTNVSTRPRAALAAELRSEGFEVEVREIDTAPLAAARLLAGRRVLPLAMPAVHEDLAAGLVLVDRGAEVVLVGGPDETAEADRVFSYRALDRAFAELRGGARLVCLHRNRWWETARGPRLDSGAFVAGLEYAAGVEAELIGKPSPAFFQAALAALGVQAAEATMVGDDVESDIAGARAVGIQAVLVRTGKFREETLAVADPKPDAVLGSVVDLADWLAGTAESEVI